MSETAASTPLSFAEELHEQRWDDHRYYHQSRVNQTLHFMSACCFFVVFGLIFVNPLAAAVLGWVVAMWVRQIGHFFFEPRGFDHINNISFEAKEAIKVGFNLQRKVALLLVWVSIPVVMWMQPDLWGLLSAPTDTRVVYDRIGWAWIGLAGAGLLARTFYLMATRNLQTGAVWFTKIVTDPFNDIKTYWKSPYYLARGQWLDPMDHVSGH